ncbi:MAG: SGNH/GDSL hydrolase family protein [Lachnospiraceae bacterium]|nr:SGNH/GDSL hydrolase family protein [Lachnospiraceae bacterium]
MDKNLQDAVALVKAHYQDGIVNFGDDSRIVKCMRRALAGEKLTVAFLGGSITQGCLSSTPQLCYAYRTYDWWERAFPESEISYWNAGIGGTTSHLGVARVQEEVLSQKPDFIIVEYSVNDEDVNPHFEETYESLVRRILMAPWKPALMLVHNVRYDDGGNAELIHRPVAERYRIPAVSMKPVIYARVAEGTLPNRAITQDDLHPNDLGHELVAGVITNYLELSKKKAVELGAKADCGGEEDQEDRFLPLPIPLTRSSYEAVMRHRNYQIDPVEITGFTPDHTPQNSVSDCFKRGWSATERGARIVFKVKGSNIAVQYRKTVRKPAPVATLYLDGDHKNGILLDANFTEDWGDCLYLETILEHGADGEHTVEIEITQTSENDAESFYLVSLITG